jgi:adenylate cyclase
MEMAKKVLAIDESLSSAHGLLCHIYILKREFDKAIAEGERAVALNPNGAEAYEQYAHSLHFSNRFKEAIPAFQKAIRLNPIGSSIAFSTLGHAYANTGRFEESVSAFKQGLLRSPDNIFAHLGLASTYIAMGREKEARAEAAEALRINPKFSLENHAKGIPFKDQSTPDKYIGNLRKAGLN